MDKDFLKISFDNKIQYLNLSSILYIDSYKQKNIFVVKIFLINKECVNFNLTSEEVYYQMIEAFDNVLHTREGI